MNASRSKYKFSALSVRSYSSQYTVVLDLKSFFAPFLLLFALLHGRPKDLLTLIKILLMIIFMSIQNISGKGK